MKRLAMRDHFFVKTNPYLVNRKKQTAGWSTVR